jgi:hypothetical protein
MGSVENLANLVYRDNSQVGKKRISKEVGEQSLRSESFDEPTAVRYLLQRIEDLLPGRSVELRVPPHGAIQCVEGLNHRRGTPPNVVEVSPSVFLELALGKTTWQAERETGRVIASGELSSALQEIFPLGSN